MKQIGRRPTLRKESSSGRNEQTKTKDQFMCKKTASLKRLTGQQKESVQWGKANPSRSSVQTSVQTSWKVGRENYQT